jgi:hypothetical protein
LKFLLRSEILDTLTLSKLSVAFRKITKKDKVFCFLSRNKEVYGLNHH